MEMKYSLLQQLLEAPISFTIRDCEFYAADEKSVFLGRMKWNAKCVKKREKGSFVIIWSTVNIS